MSICQLQPEYDIGSPHGTWMDEERSKMTCIKEGGKKGRHVPAFLRHFGGGLHAEIECRKV